MKESPRLALVSAIAFGLVTSAVGQGTLAFNNLDARAPLVTVCPGSHLATPLLLNQDLNFMLLAGPVGGPVQLIHQWLLSDGSAKGIHVGPGRFKDPSDGVYTVAGVAPGQHAWITIIAWAGYYNTYDATLTWGRTIDEMATGTPGEPPPSVFPPELLVYGVSVAYNLSALGIDGSHGLPRLSLTGQLGYGYALEYASSLSASAINPWQSLMNQTNWVLTNSPQFFTDTSGAEAAQRFYRVGLFPTPPPPSLVWINPGTFLMGSPTNEADRDADEGPQTQVTLTYGFWIGQYEVKQIEYQPIMAQNASWFIGDPDLPVDTLTWDDGTNYCARLTEHERLAGRLPAGYVYRLPTEAEWEYAARAGTTTRFSYGDDPGFTNLTNYAWYAANSGHQTHPVGQKQPNPWGLYDTYGNVEEWCLDWYGTYPGGTVANPNGPASGSARVMRGGEYGMWGVACRSASRDQSMAQNWFPYMGLRVVLAPPLPP